MPSEKIRTRKKFVDRLEGAWILLDKARSFGEERENILHELLELTSELLSPGCEARVLEEVLALTEFIYYEHDHSGEIYRLRQGVQHLEAAIEEYSGHMSALDRAKLEYTLLGELLNLFLTGEQIPSGRVEHLYRLIEKGEELLKTIPEKETLLKAKCLISLGEALKEKAMVTEDSDSHIEAFENARDYCRKAISLLQNMDELDSKYFLGMAYRHLAVTFELEGDICSDKTERKQKYQQWQDFSHDAVQILSSLDEYAARAYALINLASSNTRFYEIEQHDPGNRQFLDASKTYLEQAIELFRTVKDYRGIGWSYYHLCENTRHRVERIQVLEPDQYSILLTDLESYANRAVAALRHTEDHLALGLAYTQFGIALNLAFLNSGESAKIKLETAVTAIQAGIKNLEKTGFYRGTGVALKSLAECQFAMWNQSTDVVYLSSAIQSLERGILSTATSLKEMQSLNRLYQLLLEQLNNLL